MGFTHLAKSEHLQYVDEDAVLFDMSKKTWPEKFFSSLLIVLLVKWI